MRKEGSSKKKAPSIRRSPTAADVRQPTTDDRKCAIKFECFFIIIIILIIIRSSSSLSPSPCFAPSLRAVLLLFVVFYASACHSFPTPGSALRTLQTSLSSFFLSIVLSGSLDCTAALLPDSSRDAGAEIINCSLAVTLPRTGQRSRLRLLLLLLHLPR